MTWAIKWRGTTEYLIGRGREFRPPYFGGYTTMVFRTRQEARNYIEGSYGFIRERPDLRGEPHCWRMPVAVRVDVKVVEPNPPRL